MIEALRVQLKSIQTKIERARQLGAPHWPLNEADTERLVIEPVLQALGYDEFDYAKHSQGQGADFPDYVILPTSDQRWVLEVKQWDARLGVREERQAVNYARNNNAQWAVLTNGRQWWIYHVSFGDLNQQRVQEVTDICDIDSAIRILKYLSSTSMRPNELGLASRALKIRAAVLAELRRENGKLLRTMRSLVAQELDMNVTLEDVSGALQSIMLLGESEPPVVAEQAVIVTQAEPTPEATEAPMTDEGIPLSLLAAQVINYIGHRPRAVRRGEARADLTSWRDLAVFVIESSDAVLHIGLPFSTGIGNWYFLNHEPFHRDGQPMRRPREVRGSDGRVEHMETNRSSSDFMRNLMVILTSIGVNPDEFIVYFG